MSEQGINRRAHDTQSAMRHFEKKGGRFLGEQQFLKPSHSANMREFRPMPTTLRAMRHIGDAAKKGDWKDSQTVSFSQIVSLVSDRLTFAEYGESPPPALVTPTETYPCQPLDWRDAVSVTPPRYTSYLPIASFFSASSVVNPPLPSSENACPVLRHRGWGEGSLSPLPSWERARVRVNRNFKTMLTRHWPSDSNSPPKSHDHVITNTSTYDYIDAITSGGAG